MRKGDKRGKILPDDFIRYRSGKMPGKERNAFEKELQKDPFAQDAAEGFAGLEADEIEADLGDLRKKLKKRTEGRQTTVLIGIAASVAVLTAVSTVFFVVLLNRPDKGKVTLSENYQPVQAKIKSDSGTINKTATEPYAERPAVKAEKQEKKEMMIKQPEPVAPVKETAGAAAAGEQDLNMAEKKSSREIRPNEEALSTVRTGAFAKSPESYLPPRPATGKQKFEKYIRENLRRPDTALYSDSTIVVLSFLVHTNGSIDSMKIIRSPGKLFSDEAIRLINEGPEWLPAEDNGKPAEDRVSVRIVFR